MTPFLAIAAIFAADLTPALNRAEPRADYIAIDVRTHNVIAQRWADADTAIPVGSLVKPILAMAWSGPYPEFDCKGAAGSCWRAQPHGYLRFPQALAQSCNAYFLQFAAQVNEDSLRATALTFGVEPPSSTRAEGRIGLGEAWRITPISLLRAYAELASRRGDPRVDPILSGLELAAREGTARELGRGILAKTGTAACVAPRRHSGDGLAIALAPAEAPRVALLVRLHDVPGAQAAKATARLLPILRQ
jgi:cell division protein FtsI/penicillin-binding protein 2